MKTDKQDKRGIGTILAFVIFLLIAIVSGNVTAIIILALLEVKKRKNNCITLGITEVINNDFSTRFRTCRSAISKEIPY